MRSECRELRVTASNAELSQDEAWDLHTQALDRLWECESTWNELDTYRREMTISAQPGIPARTHPSWQTPSFEGSPDVTSGVEFASFRNKTCGWRAG
eukprot:943767-Amphidinium_carterae.1